MAVAQVPPAVLTGRAMLVLHAFSVTVVALVCGLAPALQLVSKGEWLTAGLWLTVLTVFSVMLHFHRWKLAALCLLPALVILFQAVG